MSMMTDIYEICSEALSAVIQKVLDDEEIAQPATLVSVREEILKEVKTTTIPLNSFSPDQLQELRNEVEALIEKYGDDALAIRFLKPRASQALTLLIEAGVDKLGRPTLSELFDELQQGLLAQLIATGDLADDETQTVTAELQYLIEKHGADAFAEEFMRYI